MSPAQRNARLLLAGDGLSAFGSWIDFLAILTLAAYQFHVSPSEMAAVSVALLLPGMLAGPWIGRLCDQGDPKRLLLGSIVGRVAATAALLVCHDYAFFVALVGLRSVFATVAPPAINVMAVRSTEAAERPRFYALLNVLNNSAKVLAPALGTVASSLGSESVALMMSLTFSAAAFGAFAFIRIAKPAAPLRAGAGAAIRPPATPPATSLAPLLWIAATAAFFVFMVNNLMPLVLQQAGFDKAVLGLLVSASGAGNILSGLWLAKRAAAKAMRGELNEMMLPALLQAAGFGMIGALLAWQPAQAALGFGLLFFVIGTFSARFAIAMSVHVATHHAASIGRAWGVLGSWQSGMIFVASLVGAAVLDALGPVLLFAIATASAFTSFALLATLRRLGVAGLRPAVPV